MSPIKNQSIDTYLLSFKIGIIITIIVDNIVPIICTLFSFLHCNTPHQYAYMLTKINKTVKIVSKSVDELVIIMYIIYVF